MNDFKFSNDFTLGLYAYLRQLELSIHRRESIDELKKYFEDKVPLKDVISFIDEKTGCSVEAISYKVPSRLSFLNVIKGAISRFVGNANLLNHKDIAHLKFLLIETFDFLSEKDGINSDPSRLRYNLRIFYESVLKQKLTRAQLKKANKVEYYNQPDWLEHFDLKEIVQASWPS